jgi:hypothetical protein
MNEYSSVPNGERDSCGVHPLEVEAEEEVRTRVDDDIPHLDNKENAF